MAVLISCRLYTLSVLCMFLYVSSVNSAEYIPVFMWESSSNPVVKKDVPALATVSADELKDIVTQKTKDKSAVVVFAEENLSVEDFSWQDEAGEGSFPNLQNATHSSSGPTYLPFVRAPLRAFHLRDWFHLKLGPNGLSPIDDALNETLLFVNLDDATSSENRPDLLKRHDAIISQVFKKLSKHHGDVFAVYTAHHSSWSGEEILTRRVRRLLQADDAEYNATGTILIVVKNMTLYDLEGDSIELAIPPDQQIEEGNTETWEFFKQGVTLKFLFEEPFSGYWAMVQVNASMNGTEFSLSPKGIEAPMTFSYHCSQEVTIPGNRESKLLMKDIQIQAFVEEGEVFGDAYDCVYFFTVPIWSGLFVCTIFSLIMAFGLSMIMDIKTMDRFDDPKGKTITINVAE